MKILWFSNTPAMGAEHLNKKAQIKGTGGWMYALNEAIKEKADLSIVFHYPYKKEAFTYKNTRFYPVYTGHIITENLKSRFLGKVYDDHFLEQYLQIIATVKPDIIHIHGTENSFLCLLGNISVPIVISIQGNLTVYQHKFFTGFNGKYLNYKNQKTSSKSILFGKNSFGRGFNIMKKMAEIEQKHLISALHIIGRTDWDKRITRILAPRSSYYTGNEVLRSDFYKSNWHNIYKAGKLVLFTTSSDNYYKGFETLCHALHLLNNLGLEIEWRVAGVSLSSSIYHITKKQLGQQFPNRGLMLLGSLEEQALIKNLQASHMYVMPSHIENSPNNLCEAMMLGMPCIATFAGGTGSILHDAEEGILVQDGDPWATAGAVLELTNNATRASAYGKAARLKAVKRHDKETIVDSLITTYSTIIKK